jgi:nickel/cobalt transporter (NicO) family protein
MTRIALSIVCAGIVCLWADAACSQNPFTSRPEPQQQAAPEPLIKNPLFAEIVLWQRQVQQKMSEIIRVSSNERSMQPLLVLAGLAFVYGMLHAAGPGHGKAAAVSYVLAHRATLTRGLLFGLSFSVIHALSGVAGVVGLRFIIQRSFSQTLESVTAATQIISFGLIALLGLVIVMNHARAALKASAALPAQATRPGVLTWAAAVGLVPCPAVVMIMLFCMSMDALVLGLVLAACISAGMATTISGVVGAVIVGKAGALGAVSEKQALLIERGVGLASGAAIALFGTLFCIANITAVLS